MILAALTILGAVSAPADYARPERLVHELLRRLPVTIELLFGSIIVVLTVGVALSIVAAMTQGGVVKVLVRALAVSLGCIPFFWLVLSLALWASIRWGHSIFGWASLDHFSARDHLAHLILPACVLAFAELPIVLNALGRVQYLRGHWKTDLAARVSLSLQELAWKLPEVMGACLLTEVAFGWPGEGRLLLAIIGSSQTTLAIALVLFIAVLTVLVRLIVRVVTGTNPRRAETGNG
jgi:peptide/nickel transport system permease protein